MSNRVRVLRRLGDCVVGDFVAVEIDGQLLEGVIQFMARAPQGGFLLTFAAEAGTWELYAVNGTCSVVSHISADAPQWCFETTALVADTASGRRFSRLA
ncbi:MAG: hypothetical protein KF754_13935 [Planctomycetes bacterium]|nr:hypothetical protein [Planctomycetota bacterium]